ncbi:MAG: hypothetical protein M1815_005610 [Lichina confinis]|nr:MAG: hypothetical protein M1815_005610 [Lichina confinis]
MSKAAQRAPGVISRRRSRKSNLGVPARFSQRFPACPLNLCSGHSDSWIWLPINSNNNKRLKLRVMIRQSDIPCSLPTDSVDHSYPSQLEQHRILSPRDTSGNSSGPR